jgi:hypothetical protein
MRQFGQSPPGAFSGKDAPHCGQVDLLLTPDNYQSPMICYTQILGSSLFSVE